ncbi:M20/M25/M40 family metallo-hydrolase, partial [Candidatus Bathyarchaeota archaeon]|nr:M20/M25/M40 family metallo-hydrolase [Candidatus Bathyarchaeota archaeon]
PKYFGASAYYEQGIISAHGVPTVCFGPSGGGAHSEEEWVDLDSVYKASRVYESVIKNYCGVDH